MLSNQLKNIANKATDAAKKSLGANMDNLQAQTSQAMTQVPAGKAAAQNIAGAVTQAGQQANIQSQQQLGGQLLGMQGQQLNQQKMLDQQRLVEKQQLNNSQIAELQRKGALKQNSKELEHSKRLQLKEIEVNKRMLGTKLQFDDKISFLTNKQREDLAKLGRYTKQQIFDSRLTFSQDEMGRKFTNLRQLADYAVTSFESDQKLKVQMREMKQASDKQLMVLEHAHKMITERMQLEFKRAEKTKDYAMLEKLQRYKIDLEKKAARKKAQSSAIGNIIVGAATVAGAYFGGPVGATAASGAAKVATGYAEGQGYY